MTKTAPDFYPIRNAFQKIKVGDVVSYVCQGRTLVSARVTEKVKGGSLRLDNDKYVYGCDVVRIVRDGQDRF